MLIQTLNPATEKPLETYAVLDNADIELQVNCAFDAFVCWRKTDFSVRQHRMLELARLLREKKNDYAFLIAQEMGKPIKAGRAEIEKCAWVCEYYAENAQSFLAPRLIQTNMHKSMVCHQPLGVVFAVMPWNFPFWQVFRFAAPTLMAGNVIILKHASVSAGAGTAIAKLFLEAGFPAAVFQNVILDKNGVAQVIAHEKIVAVTLTGSEEAGRVVSSQASKYLKKSVLELGGSDPYVVLADADVELAAQCIVDSRLNNCGQVCIAAKRTIVVSDIVEQLVASIIKKMNQYKMGDPLDLATNLGPMARSDLRLTLNQQILDSVKKGAKLCVGGVIPEGRGFYYPPTLLTNVNPGMPAFDEELFGPVIAVITAADEIDAIRLANQSRYGLGAAVFTRNVARGEHIAMHEIEAGACFVNAQVTSDPRLPFGGIKQSGFGRELSKEGILEFVNIKTVSISVS